MINVLSKGKLYYSQHFPISSKLDCALGTTVIRVNERSNNYNVYSNEADWNTADLM